MTAFDPAQHRMVPEQRWFDDFRIGERFVLPSRTMTEAVFLAFQAASGDAHPIHYDVEFCKVRGMPGLLAHGLQTLAQSAPGAGLFPYMTEESLVGFIEQSSRFRKPVFAGDTVFAWSQVIERLDLPGRGDVGALRLRLIATKNRPCADFPYKLDRDYDPAVILDLDYCAVMPR